MEISRWHKPPDGFDLDCTPAGSAGNLSFAMPSTHPSLHYHRVSSTKDRMRMIDTQWKERLHGFLGGTWEGWNMMIATFGEAS